MNDKADSPTSQTALSKIGAFLPNVRAEQPAEHREVLKRNTLEKSLFIVIKTIQNV